MKLLWLLRRRPVALLWATQVLSAMGDHLYDLAVVWVAAEVAGAGAGIVVAANALTRLAVGMLGGVLADRWDRRTAMIAADLLRAATVGVLPILALAGSLELWHLAVASALLGAFGSLFNPALLATLPSLARGSNELQALTGLMDGTTRLAMAIAPSLSGLLLVVMPLPRFFALDAFTFLASAGAIVAIRRHLGAAQQPSESQTQRPSVLREALGAVQFVRNHSVLRWYVSTLIPFDIAWAAAFRIGLALLAAQQLGGDVATYGLLMGAYGVGNVLSNLVVSSWTINQPLAALVAARFILGAGFALAAVAPVAWVAMLGTGIAAIGGPLDDITVKTMIQRDVPSGQIGKVYSLQTTAAQGGLGLGLLLAAPLFALLGPRTGIAVCAAVMVATGVIGWLTIGRSRLPDQQPAFPAT